MFVLCNNTLYHNNKSWFSFMDTSYRPIVDNVYDLGYTSPFRVRIGETVFLRDDGSLSLPWVKRNRILFPTFC